jgi:hypothetical protein
MLFTDVSEIGTNVVTLADEELEIVLQEKGGVNHDGDDEDDYDGDKYYEYTGHYEDVDDDFYGIEYPPLIPKTALEKAPRVEFLNGVDSYLRVLSKVNIFHRTSDNETPEDTDDEWVAITGSAINTLLAQCFGVQTARGGDFTPRLVDSATYLLQNKVLMPNGKPVESLYQVPDPADSGAVKTYITFADFVKDVLSGVNTNQYNWEFVELDACDGIYYYVESTENPWNDPSHADTAPAVNAHELAIFNGDITFNAAGEDFTPATAPLFTQVQVPNFTNSMAAILKDYKIALQFEAQAVQKANNEYTVGSGTWDDIFSELGDYITTAVPGAPNPAGEYIPTP